MFANVLTLPLLVNRVLLVLYQVHPTLEIFHGLKGLFEKKPQHITLLVVSPQNGSKPLHRIATERFKHDVHCTFKEHTIRHRNPFFTTDQSKLLENPVKTTDKTSLRSDDDEDDALLSEEGLDCFYKNAGVNLARFKNPRHSTNIEELSNILDLFSETDACRIEHPARSTNFTTYKQEKAVRVNVKIVKKSCSYNALEIRDLLSSSSWFPTLGQKFLEALPEDTRCAAYAMHADLFLPNSVVTTIGTKSIQHRSVPRQMKRRFESTTAALSSDTPQTPAKVSKVLREPFRSIHASTNNNSNNKYSQLQVTGPKIIQPTSSSSRTEKIKPTIYTQLPPQFRISASRTYRHPKGSGDFLSLRVASVTQPSKLLYKPVPTDHSIYGHRAYALKTKKKDRLVAVVVITNPAQPPQLHLVLSKSEAESSLVVADILKGFEGVDIRNGLFAFTENKQVCAGIYLAERIPTKSVDVVEILQQHLTW